MCRKKSQLSLFQKAKAYTDDFDSCFGIRTAIDDDMMIVKDTEELSKSTDGLESRFIMLVPSPVILDNFVFPYQQTLFYDMASPSRAVNLAALNNFEK